MAAQASSTTGGAKKFGLCTSWPLYSTILKIFVLGAKIDLGSGFDVVALEFLSCRRQQLYERPARILETKVNDRGVKVITEPYD